MDKLTANELRIGNLLEYNGEIREVAVINLDEVGFKVPLTIQAISINRFEWNQVNPIPLTEEWLLLFGFEKEGSEWKLFPCFEIQIIVFNEGLYNGVMFYTRTIHTDYRPIYCTKHINHVHQLQNLYFALTGEELTIKSN